MTLVLMAWGPFRFGLQTYVYEALKRRSGARIESVKVIGARPSLHYMGPDDEKLSLTCTFHPGFLPGNQGLTQLALMRKSYGLSYPMVGARGVVGDVFGRWALERIDEDEKDIGPSGVGQEIVVGVDFVFDGRNRTAGALGAIRSLFG